MNGHAGGFTVGADHPPRCDRRRARVDAAAGVAFSPRAYPSTSSCARRMPASSPRAPREASSPQRSSCGRARVRISRPSSASDANCAQREYSHVLVATEDPGGYRLAGSVGAPVRIGFADPWGKPLKTLWSRRFLTGQHLSQRGTRSARAARVRGALPPRRAAARRTSRRRAISPSCGRSCSKANPRPTNESPCRSPTNGSGSGSLSSGVVELVRRIAAAGTPHLLAAAREAAYAERIARSTRIRRRLFRRAGAVEGGDRRSAGDRHAGLRRVARRRHDWNAGGRGLSAGARLRAAGRALGAVGGAASYRPRRRRLARASDDALAQLRSVTAVELRFARCARPERSGAREPAVQRCSPYSCRRAESGKLRIDQHEANQNRAVGRLRQ